MKLENLKKWNKVRPVVIDIFDDPVFIQYEPYTCTICPESVYTVAHVHCYLNNDTMGSPLNKQM